MAGLSLAGCKKGEKVPNLPPETHMAVNSINLSGENRLNSLVTLQWWGTDPDGIVVSYEISLDQSNWTLTTRQDSTFLFSIQSGSDTVDIDLWVRAVDNNGEKDPTPAYLKVPVKNTPPVATFDRALVPADTSHTLITLAWQVSDPDGDGTITSIELKANDGPWVELPTSESAVVVFPTEPTKQGTVQSKIIYVDGSSGPDIHGVELNAWNTFYLRARDVAGSESMTDTIHSVYVTSQVSDMLVIGAHPSSPKAFYTSHLKQAGVDFDFIDYALADGKNQPRIWNPTFELLLSRYNRVLIYANEMEFTSASNQQDILLEFAAQGLQAYANAGGKICVSSSFPNDFNPNSILFGILPIKALSSPAGKSRLPTDSLLVGSHGYPNLVSSAFIAGLDPFYPSEDGQVVYTAQLTNSDGPVDSKVVGVRRVSGSETAMVFFSVELHRVNKDPDAINALFDKIFNQELK
ncbi:MAG: hypothetical protein Kow0075_00700 [Salibacteraceae bacterium]